MTIEQQASESLYALREFYTAELSRKDAEIAAMREVVDRVKSDLGYIIANDKTEYGYKCDGKEWAENRKGQMPPTGERFMTPREIAISSLGFLARLDEIRGKVE